MRSPTTRTTRHGAHARTKAPAPPGHRRDAEPPRSARDTTRRAAELAACEAGLPAALPGGFRLERLSKNRRSGDTLYVYRKEGGGTFCANQKGVRTRLARLTAERERAEALPPVPAPPPDPEPPSEIEARNGTCAASRPQSDAEVRCETPGYAAITVPTEAGVADEADEVAEAADAEEAGWLRRYARPALIAAALVGGAALVIRVAIALGA